MANYSRRVGIIGQQMEYADVDPQATAAVWLSWPSSSSSWPSVVRPSARHFSRSWPPTRRVAAAPPTTMSIARESVSRHVYTLLDARVIVRSLSNSFVVVVVIVVLLGIHIRQGMIISKIIHTRLSVSLKWIINIRAFRSCDLFIYFIYRS